MQTGDAVPVYYLPEDATWPVPCMLEPTADTETVFDPAKMSPMLCHNGLPLNISLLARVKDSLVEQAVDGTDTHKLGPKYTVWAYPIRKADLLSLKGLMERICFPTWTWKRTHEFVAFDFPQGSEKELTGKLYDATADPNRWSDIRVEMDFRCISRDDIVLINFHVTRVTACAGQWTVVFRFTRLTRLVSGNKQK
ncbi:hypothetical protein NM688_g5596 [Phlebia brevispora]|uniref:Uncharacterized protein n=1 Tax=Phlebia brevispora TaxID=194682 RepID=A0ACC1SSQ7_9APHY|nr:hypothetical protein NM688_g5596 [Phlebia brevispora]